MYASLLDRHNQNVKGANFRREFQIATLQVFLNEALQALKENPDDCEQRIFNSTTFHRFYVCFFRLFFRQSKAQTDSDSVINTLRLHLLNQNLSLEQKIHDAKKYISKSLKSSLKLLMITALNLKFLRFRFSPFLTDF